MSFFRAHGLLLLICLLVSACKKPVIPDTALIPDDNLNLKFTDTLSVLSYTVKEDSVDVSDATLCALGIMDDPVFGKTYASFYQPFTLESDDVEFDSTSVTLDSIVVYLRYFSTYGDPRYPLTVEVFELLDSVAGAQGFDAFGNPIQVDYTSNKSFRTDSRLLGKTTFVPNMRDSIVLDGIKYAVLRIKLDNSWGQKFIDSIGTSIYTSRANFLRFFKGLYFSCSRSDVGQVITFFDPYYFNTNPVTKVTLYHHSIQDTSFTDFPAAPLLVVNRFIHDYNNTTVENYISSNREPFKNDSLVFIQGLAGMNTKVLVPHIRNLGNILINKAELAVTQINSGSDSTFSAPSTLTMLKSDAQGDFDGITLDQLRASVFGGTKSSETDSISGITYTRYRFNLSRYYQDVLSGVPDYGLFILPDRRYQFAHRMVAGGGSHSQFRMKLNLTYTVIE